MGGFITERDFTAAEGEFPGIRRYYEALEPKPATFLQLLWAYEHQAIGSTRPMDGRRPGQSQAG